MEFTPNSNLYKWNQADKKIDTITEMSNNMDKIDTLLAEIADDDTFTNNHFLSHLASYIGVINEGYVNDNGTRFYIIPKNKVTTGLGGAMKIFADAYHLDDVNYRDTGLYFHQNQAGDTGHYGNGVFWINSKVNGTYAGKNHDIGFSAQDGAIVGGRFTFFKDPTNGDRAVFVVGSGKSQISNQAGFASKVKLEVQGDIGLRNADFLRFMNAAGTALMGIGSDASNYLISESINGEKHYVNGVMVSVVAPKYTNFNHQIRRSTLITVNDGTTIPVVDSTNRVKFEQPSPTTVTDFTGFDGQELVCYFANGNTTLQAGGKIKLAGGTNLNPTTGSLVTFENINGIWFEKSRSLGNA